MSPPALPERHPDHRCEADRGTELDHLASRRRQNEDNENSDTDVGDHLEAELPEGGSLHKVNS